MSRPPEPAPPKAADKPPEKPKEKPLHDAQGFRRTARSAPSPSRIRSPSNMFAAQPGFGRNYGRSMVITQQGVVATSQVLASQAGAQILAQGGSAIDAAIAANAVLGVVEPMMDGIGGDLFVLYWDAKTGELTGLNASGPAPRALSPAFLASAGITAMPLSGIHAVTVPGAVDGWAQLHQHYGNLPWDRLFAAAIAYAEQGFPVSEAIEEQWTSPVSFDRLTSHAESSRVFLVDGNPPRQGDLFRNPGLASGPTAASPPPALRAFYEGANSPPPFSKRRKR